MVIDRPILFVTQFIYGSIKVRNLQDSVTLIQTLLQKKTLNQLELKHV